MSQDERPSFEQLPIQILTSPVSADAIYRNEGNNMWQYQRQFQRLSKEIDVDKVSLIEVRGRLHDNVTELVDKYDELVGKMEAITTINQSLRNSPIPRAQSIEPRSSLNENQQKALMQKYTRLQREFNDLKKNTVDSATFAKVMNEKDQAFMIMQREYEVKVQRLQSRNAQLEYESKVQRILEELKMKQSNEKDTIQSRSPKTSANVDKERRHSRGPMNAKPLDDVLEEFSTVCPMKPPWRKPSLDIPELGISGDSNHHSATPSTTTQSRDSGSGKRQRRRPKKRKRKSKVAGTWHPADPKT